MADGVGVVARARLVARLDEAVLHRLTLVVADAGFGKSELLAQWLEHVASSDRYVLRPVLRDVAGLASALASALAADDPQQAARLSLVARSITGEHERTDSLAGVLCEALAGRPDLDVTLVLDDAQQLPERTLRFVESLLRQAPPSLHLLLLSRQELPFSLDRLEDPVQRLTGVDLGFDDDELTELLRQVAGDEEHASAVRALLGRWPAAVRLGAERIARVPADRRTSELLRIKAEGGQDLIALAHDVISSESEQTRWLATVVAPYDAFSAELGEALGCVGAADTIRDLASRGLVVPLGFDRVQYYAFPRLLRDFVRVGMPMPPDERPALVRTAGLWFEEAGQVEGALRCAIDQQDSSWAARLLRRHGRLLVEAGRSFRVSAALAVVGDADRDAVLDEVEGALHDAAGEHDAALLCFRRAIDRDGEVGAWLAYRMGFLLYFQGDLDEALQVLSSAHPPTESAEHALLTAWRATVLWAKGQPDAGLELAVAALDLAERLDDPQALAASHTIIAILADHRGDSAQSRLHYDIALENAERAGDVLQVVRLRNNRGGSLIEKSDLDAALPELEVAIELAQASGLRFYLSAALTNRGQLRFHQGQYDAALADLERANELDHAAGTSSSATRIYLAHVYRHRGYANAARVAYEQVLAVGRSTGDATLIVPALCGVAQLVAEADPELATVLVNEALSFDSGVNAVLVLLTAGWVAHAQERWAAARAFAERAATEADLRGDLLGQAEALHLAVVSDPVVVPDDPRLQQAAAIVDRIGAPVWRARVLLEQARRMPPSQALVAIAEVRQLALSLGARNLADRAAALARDLDSGDSTPQIEILTLGGFRVRREGQPLGLAEWLDDKASGLLKRLTSVSSLTWTRMAMTRSLWPGSPAEDGEELLVELIDMVRLILDPSGAFDAEHFLESRADTISLRNVDIDVHAFFAEAAAGIDAEEGRDELRRAEARYSGDYLEEHPGEAWAMTLREEARARYVEVARALAQAAARTDEPDLASRYCRRILERDPYDEGAHLSLITALATSGSTPEARSCYATYVARLDELGLEAIPWALVSTAVLAA